MKLADVKTLREMLDYDAAAGVLKWKLTQRAGMIAGSKNNRGYMAVKICGSVYQAHRICWALYHGDFPHLYIDHVNGDKCDNRIANLRLASMKQNLRNRGMQKTNKTGFKGVHVAAKTGKFRAQLKVDGVQNWLGDFDTPEAAYSAYCDAAYRVHGDFFHP